MCAVVGMGGYLFWCLFITHLYQIFSLADVVEQIPF